VNSHATINATEKSRLRWLIFALLLAISLPYFWASGITPDGFVYSGFLYNPDDQNVHLMWARQASEGRVFFLDLLTTENITTGEKPLFTNLLIWLMGVVSGLTTIPLVWMYHGTRVALAALLLWWFYVLTARLTDDRRTRFLATVLAGFSGGGGWIGNILPALSTRNFIDRPDNNGFPMMPEAFGFHSVLIFPLNVASMALLSLIYTCVLRAQEGEKRAIGIGAFAALLLANIHTYDAIPLGITLFLWSAYRFATKRPHAMAPLLIAIGAAPTTLYQLYVFKNSSDFRLKALTPTPPPPIFDTLISYGPLLLLAIGGAMLLWKNERARLLMLWPIVAIGISYAPISFGRKMIEGAHLPMCFFAALALSHLAQKLTSPAARKGLVTGACALLCLSSAHFLNWALNHAPMTITSGVRFLLPPLYLSQGDADALRFLEAKRDAETQPRAVLSMNLLGNYLPQKTGYHAFVGHWAETLNFFDDKTKTGKIVDVQNFYKGRMANDEALKWLRENHIAYVVEGFYETRLFPAENLPSRRFGWTPLWSGNGTAIYAVPQ
jgi:hypothetical protein